MTTQKYEVVNHIPRQLYKCLEHFKEQQGLNYISHAVNTIIEEYFELEFCQNSTSDRVEEIVKELKNELAELKKEISQIQQSLTSDANGKIKTTNSQGELLNTKQLAARLSVEEIEISQHKTDGKEFVEWSKSKDPEQISWQYAGANLFERI